MMQYRQHSVLLFVVMIITSLSSVCSAAPSVAGVLSSHGKLLVKRKGTGAFVALSSNGRLYVGDIVGTGPGSKAKLLFNNGSQFGLNANSAVEITAPTKVANGRQSFVRALSGQIWARLRPGNAVHTPSATLGVSGTLVNLDIAGDGATTLTVIDGEVDFYNNFGATVVSTSQQSTARPGAAPTKPITIPNAGLIIEWTVDLEQAVIPREKFFTSVGTPAALTAEVKRRGQMVVAKPDDAESYRDYGDALFDARDFEAALAAWQRANQIAPSQAPTLVRLGYAQLELNNVDEAKAAFDAALQIDANNLEALVGAGHLQLAKNRPEEAQRTAEKALAVSGQAEAAPTIGKSAEAYIVLGLALMRQPDKVNEAKNAFEAAVQHGAATYHYQAHAWLAMLALAQSDNARAMAEGRKAIELAPNSALAHGNLALAYFYGGNTRLSEREARRATALNPQSPAALVALGQALLARGNTNGAAHAAAQAIALDPRLASAHYLSGIAAAQSRDYRHAVIDLKESMLLAPDFLPAAAALARVYARQGREAEALELLTGVQQRQGESATSLLAIAEVHHEQGRYALAREQYRAALRLNTASALSYAGLARLSLDANRLSEAIEAAQQAVRLAPHIGQYHAILGLAYDYSELDGQAEREFRSALALDPQNALALARLAVRNKEGDTRTAERTAGLTFAQAFLLDPAISRQLLRGGVQTEIAPLAGPDSQGLTLLQRDHAARGQVHTYTQAAHLAEDGDRPNSDERRTLARLDATLQHGPRANLYAHALHQRLANGLPGTRATPVADDRREFRFAEAIVGARQRVSARGALWAGLFTGTQDEERLNPNRDPSFARSGGLFSLRIAEARRSARATTPELRFDYDWSRSADRTRLLTLGMARPRVESWQHEDWSVPAPFTGSMDAREKARTSLGYVRWTQQVGSRFSFSGQLRRQSLRSTVTATGGIVDANGTMTPVIVPAPGTSQKAWLPSIVANYFIERRTLLRVLAGKRLTDTTGSIFAPTDTILSTERQTLPTGLPDCTRIVQVDLERYIGSGFVKLFAFQASASNLVYDFSSFANPQDLDRNTVVTNNTLNLGNVQRRGIGVRYERPISRMLFAQATLAVNRTTSSNPAFAGASAPYHPRAVGTLAVNYVAPGGYKMGVSLQRTSSFFQDTATLGAARPQFPAKTTIDLTLARERSVRHELFVRVRNLFNARQIVFNDVPVSGRRIILGIANRF